MKSIPNWFNSATFQSTPSYLWRRCMRITTEHLKWRKRGTKCLLHGCCTWTRGAITSHSSHLRSRGQFDCRLRCPHPIAERWWDCVASVTRWGVPVNEWVVPTTPIPWGVAAAISHRSRRGRSQRGTPTLAPTLLQRSRLEVRGRCWCISRENQLCTWHRRCIAHRQWSHWGGMCIRQWNIRYTDGTIHRPTQVPSLCKWNSQTSRQPRLLPFMEVVRVTPRQALACFLTHCKIWRQCLKLCSKTRSCCIRGGLCACHFVGMWLGTQIHS